MSPPAPKIGFDRFIPIAWATAALQTRGEATTLDDLHAMLRAAGLGAAALKKTRTVLNRLWLEPRPDLADFAARGVALFKQDPGVPPAALSWGMAIATYPFFGKVAELVGRLSALQGDCSSAEVHRRMSESFGEREGTYRMTNMVLQTQASWGALERAEKGNRLTRKSPIVVGSAPAVAWLAEAALRYASKAVPLEAISSLPVLYPFLLDQPVGYVLSTTSTFEVRSESAGRVSVQLHAA